MYLVISENKYSQQKENYPHQNHLDPSCSQKTSQYLESVHNWCSCDTPSSCLLLPQSLDNDSRWTPRHCLCWCCSSSLTHHTSILWWQWRSCWHSSVVETRSVTWNVMPEVYWDSWKLILRCVLFQNLYNLDPAPESWGDVCHPSYLLCWCFQIQCWHLGCCLGDQNFHWNKQL